jgi:hypothetical protein
VFVVVFTRAGGGTAAYVSFQSSCRREFVMVVYYFETYVNMGVYRDVVRRSRPTCSWSCTRVTSW